MLSTGAIQVRYEGGTILNLECPFDDVTYLDKFGMITAVPLAKAVGLGRDDLKRRLDYVTNNITDIVTTLSRNHYFCLFQLSFLWVQYVVLLEVVAACVLQILQLLVC